MIGALLTLALVVVSLAGLVVLARWQATREERRQRLLAESWAVYRASRAIHDETVRTLQAMLAEARRTRRPG